LQVSLLIVQSLVQLPQCAGSVFKLTHAPLQLA
jgi:hypothetical protein